jgi:hypothetical protein
MTTQTTVSPGPPVGTGADRRVLILSDIEMGAGGETDDFPHSDFLGRLLLSCLEGPLCEHPLDIVFNGDTFDLLKTPYEGGYPHQITRDIALAKMSAVAAAHPRFFEALRTILEHPEGNKSVHFLVGNHDTDLLFPEVQAFLRALCGKSESVRFPGLELAIGPVHMEHGSQADPLFRIDPERPFVEADGQPLLNISWATIALLDVMLPLHPILHFHERLRPRHLVFDLIPEIKELLMATAWRYWTRDFWREFITLKDPLLKLNWSLVKEVVKRFTLGNPDVSFDKKWLSEKVEEKPFELFVTGHVHTGTTYYHGSTRIIQAGPFRDEYFILDDGHRFRPVLKPYYEIFLKGEEVVAWASKEVRGPERPQTSIPGSIYDVVPAVKERLAELGDRTGEEEKREEEERRELKEASRQKKEETGAGK